MIKFFRYSPSRLALLYIALGILMLAMFAVPLWYAWGVNISTFKAYVDGEQARTLVDIFDQEGAAGLATAIESRLAQLPGDEIIVFADASKQRLAGNLATWPAEVPDAAGTYGLVTGGSGPARRVVASHWTLGDGYHLLMGRESARFQSLVDYFWFGIVAATVIVLLLGGAIAMMIRRALLDDLREMSSTAAAIVKGDLSRRLPTRRRSDALDTLATTVNDMLEQLAHQNVQLEDQIDVRRQVESALHRAHEELEGLVAQRTRQLAEANVRYALAVDAAGDGHSDWIVGSDELHVSPRLLEMCGLAPGTSFCGRADFLRLFPFHPEDRARVIHEIDAHLAADTIRMETEMRIVRRGETRWLHLTGLCSRDATGRLVRWNAALTDVTEGKRAEAARLLSEERYARAMEASEEGHWEWNMTTEEMFLSPRIRTMLGFEDGAHFANREDFFLRQPIHPDDREHVKEARRNIVTDQRYQIEYRIILRSGEIRWMRSRGKVFMDGGTHAKRITGTLTDITDSKVVNEAFRRSEERFSLAVAGSSDGIWDWDIETGQMFFSERTQVLHGLEPGPTVRQRAEWRAVFKLHPDDVQPQARAIEDYVAGRAPDYDGEWRVLHRDGSYRWVRGRGLCVRDAAGRATRMVGAVSDIDTRKRAAAALQYSEERYALAMEASGEGHWDWNIATDEYYASPRMLELYGFPPDTVFSGRSDFLDRFPFHPEDRPEWEAAVAAHFAGETARFEIEIRMVPHGETRWIHLTGLLSRDAAGKPTRWTGSVTDVTARRSAEEALRLSEHRYALAMDATGDGHWDWNIPVDKVYASPLLLEMCGLALDRTFVNRAQWVDAFPFYGDERVCYERAVAEHFAGRTPRLDIEVRIVPRGEIRWLHMTGRCSRDEAGVPVRWAGAVTDITARKRIDGELRARQDMLDLAQKAARAVAFEWRIGAGDGENRWSPDLETMFGLVPGSYDGTFEAWKGLVYPEDWPKTRAAIKEAQTSGER